MFVHSFLFMHAHKEGSIFVVVPSKKHRVKQLCLQHSEIVLVVVMFNQIYFAELLCPICCLQIKSFFFYPVSKPPCSL